MRESKLPALGFYILKSSPIRKEKIKDIRVQGCSLNDPPQITCTVLAQPYCRATGSYDWLYMVIGPDTAAHMIVNFLQNYMTEAGKRQPQG